MNKTTEIAHPVASPIATSAIGSDARKTENYENLINNYQTRENELILALEAVVHRCQQLEGRKDTNVVYR